MAKKLIPKNIKSSLKKTIKSQGGKTAEPTYTGLNKARDAIKEQTDAGKLKRKSVTWNIDIGDLVRIKNHNKSKDIKVGVVLTKIQRTNHYTNEDREYVTIATPDNSHFEISPKRLIVLQRMS